MREEVRRPRRVVIYGRVSTEHEAQLSAFENQQAWYENIANQYSDWIIVDHYYDEGTSGTTTNRPQFMRMIQEAKENKFDLIVTREVCRFARNTVDTLTITRNLKKISVEVYFINDNIWTMDGDGELRLSLMATLAQEESRKISERVLAGQKISREKGVLYGNGNILGYDRNNGNYVVNKEQAATVQKIFNLYDYGLGYKSICGELTQLGFKNASGKVEWTVDRIGRMIRNPTYKGYIGYNKSHVGSFLEHNRINYTADEFQLIKGNFEPIVSEELWNRCAAKRERKCNHYTDKNGKKRKFGGREHSTVYTKKLRCSCGSSFRYARWHANENGTNTYGFECYRQKRQASPKYAIEHNLDPMIICTSKTIPSWHVEMMAHAVFNRVWGDRQGAVVKALEMLKKCATRDMDENIKVTAELEKQLQKLSGRLKRFQQMRADEELNREDYLANTRDTQEQMDAIKAKIKNIKVKSEDKASTYDLNFDAIQKTLQQWSDFSSPRIAEELVEQFILQAVEIDDNTFNWTLNLSKEMTKGESDGQQTASEISVRLYRERMAAKANKYVEKPLSNHIKNPQTVDQFTITRDEAKRYCDSIGLKFFGKKWHDKVVIISI